jgi:hypothetical protein
MKKHKEQANKAVKHKTGWPCLNGAGVGGYQDTPFHVIAEDIK